MVCFWSNRELKAFKNTNVRNSTLYRSKIYLTTSMQIVLQVRRQIYAKYKEN